MLNSKLLRRQRSVFTLAAVAAAFALTCLSSTQASAQVQPQGFNVERFYPSAPGGGWMVMDDINLKGGLGGALSFSTGYSHNPLKITSSDGSQHLALVKHQAFFEFGAAATYDRFRFYFNANSPIAIHGDSGTIDGYNYAPGVSPITQHNCGQERVCTDVGWNPDSIADARVGFDARIWGEPGSKFRLGLSTQVIIPSPKGNTVDYITDGSFRGMDRVLVAGDFGKFSYAGHVGVHFRRLNESAPGSPRGSELLFGLAAGPRVALTRDAQTVFIFGPEIFGATAFKSFFGSDTTALEALLSGRIEGTKEDGAQMRFKMGIGTGLHSEFGAPDFRCVIAVETFDRSRSSQ